MTIKVFKNKDNPKRYTVCFQINRSGMSFVYIVDEDQSTPNAVNQFVFKAKISSIENLGEKVPFETLPKDVKHAIAERIED